MVTNSQHAKLRTTTSSNKNGMSSSYSASGEADGGGRQSSSAGTSATTTTTTMAQVMEIFRKSLKPGSDWPEKDDLLDVVHWGRQIMGALIGVVWGVIPIYGIFGIGVYVALTTAIVHLYVTVYQRQDEERVGGFWELAKEGFGSSFATFLVCWILVYTAVHFDSSAAYDDHT